MFSHPETCTAGLWKALSLLISPHGPVLSALQEKEKVEISSTTEEVLSSSVAGRVQAASERDLQNILITNINWPLVLTARRKVVSSKE